MARPPAFIVRHRTAMAIAAALLSSVLFVLHALHWHAPYRLERIAQELPVLLLAVVAGIGLGLGAARIVPSLRRAGAPLAIAVAALAIYVVLRQIDPFAAARTWLYAPAGCDHGAQFPRRATVTRGNAVGQDGRRTSVERAAYVAVGEAVSLSAECVVLPDSLDAADRAGLRAITERQLRASAAQVRLTVESVERTDNQRLALRGSSEAGRDARNEPLLRAAEARVYFSPRSMLILWAWATLPTADRRVPEIARRLLDGAVRSRP